MTAVQGLDRFNRRWKAIPQNVRKRVKAVMEQIAYDIVEDMYSLVRQQTGDLAGSINWTWGEEPCGFTGYWHCWWRRKRPRGRTTIWCHAHHDLCRRRRSVLWSLSGVRHQEHARLSILFPGVACEA